MRLILCVVLALAAGTNVAAQDQTLADIRQDLTLLNIEIQRLKRELSTTGASGAGSASGSVLDRVNALETQLQRLTGKTEELEFRIDRVVRDGTNRIGDLEFRLVELEGGDVSQLGETSTLGGEAPSQVAAATPAPATTGDTQLAVGEQADFDAAQAALEAGDADTAAAGFSRFREVYPGSPFEPQALLGLGKALDAQGDVRSAARAWLDSYSGYPQSTVAPEALFRVGEALGRLGKPQEACVTLAEVGARFPGDPFVAEAANVRAQLGC